jgi:hypothetical protein
MNSLFPCPEVMKEWKEKNGDDEEKVVTSRVVLIQYS